jgi:hypothetical protein
MARAEVEARNRAVKASKKPVEQSKEVCGDPCGNKCGEQSEEESDRLPDGRSDEQSEAWSLATWQRRSKCQSDEETEKEGNTNPTQGQRYSHSLRDSAIPIPLRYSSIPIPLRTSAMLISFRTPPTTGLTRVGPPPGSRCAEYWPNSGKEAELKCCRNS